MLGPYASVDDTDDDVGTGVRQFHKAGVVGFEAEECRRSGGEKFEESVIEEAYYFWTLAKLVCLLCGEVGREALKDFIVDVMERVICCRQGGESGSVPVMESGVL